MSTIDFKRARALLAGSGDSTDRDGVIQKLTRFSQTIGPDAFRKEVVREILRVLRVDDLIPRIYADYRDIVRDGFRFILSGISMERFIRIAADQLLLDENAPPPERLFQMAGSMPTLHKLGQTMARNRNIDPTLRKWLIGLENGGFGANPEAVREAILGEIRNYSVPLDIRLDQEILSEASVGAVVGFTWTAPDTGQTSRGAFKVLKPGVRENLKEEFDLIDGLARYFHNRRDRYALRNFTFVETFRDIRSALTDEIDLSGEQAHLRRASRFYANTGAVSIPEVLPFSTGDLTAMTRMDGAKITEHSVVPADRRHLARTLFQTMIWKPLFSLERRTPFHGDPHAGNLFGVSENGAAPRAVLLDWSLSGTLTRDHRTGLVRLMMSILTDDPDQIHQAAISLSSEILGGAPNLEREPQAIIQKILDSPEYKRCHPLERAFHLIDQAALEGIRFPKDLLLFRKAFFTLDGVLRELDPEFSIDRYAAPLLKELFLEELPGRWTTGMIPRLDRPGKFKSLVTNRELQIFLFRYLLENLHSLNGWIGCIGSGSELMGKQTALFFRQMASCYSEAPLSTT